MPQAIRPLPHWTWDDLEAALSQFDQTRQLEPLKAHLLEELRSESELTDGPELLRHVLSVGWVIAQVGATATAPLLEAGSNAS